MTDDNAPTPSPGEPFDVNAFIARLDENGRRAGEARLGLYAACIVASRGMSALTRVGWIGATGSAREFDTRSGLLGIGDESVADLISSEVGVQLRVVADLLRGYGSLIVAQSSHVGTVSLARGVYEACLWAQAILDRTITAEERIHRALNRRLARHWTTQGTLLGPTPEDEEAARESIEEILEWARDRDIPWGPGKGRRSPFVGEVLSATKAAENADLPVGLGLHAWQHPSAISHGEHGSDDDGWLAMSTDHEISPAWLSAIRTPGVSVGLFLVARALTRHIGRPTIVGEWQVLHQRWWVMCAPTDDGRPASAPNWMG